MHESLTARLIIKAARCLIRLFSCWEKKLHIFGNHAQTAIYAHVPHSDSVRITQETYRGIHTFTHSLNHMEIPFKRERGRKSWASQPTSHQAFSTLGTQMCGKRSCMMHFCVTRNVRCNNNNNTNNIEIGITSQKNCYCHHHHCQ